MTSKLSHIEINVINYAEAIRFYDIVLAPLGFKRTVCTTTWTSYSDGQLKIILGPTEEKHKEAGYHRKRAGLNHLAFYAETKEEVDLFYTNILKKHKIKVLYEDGPFGNDENYAVFFEGPDRLKLELMYGPHYCEEDAWPSNIESDFDPYSKAN